MGDGKITLKNAKATALDITSTSTANYEERWFINGDDNYNVSELGMIIHNDDIKEGLPLNLIEQPGSIVDVMNTKLCHFSFSSFKRIGEEHINK